MHLEIINFYCINYKCDNQSNMSALNPIIHVCAFGRNSHIYTGFQPLMKCYPSELRYGSIPWLNFYWYKVKVTYKVKTGQRYDLSGYYKFECFFF